jgi:hypothetical protein
MSKVVAINIPVEANIRFGISNHALISGEIGLALGVEASEFLVLSPISIMTGPIVVALRVF